MPTDSLSPNFDIAVFTLYDTWRNLADSQKRGAARASIARGEALFNTRQFTISNVNGLNLLATDPVGSTPVIGTCTTCHDSPNVGNHSSKLALDIGVADAAPPVLDVTSLPRFTVQCIAGPLAGQSFEVSDLGRALITIASCSRRIVRLSAESPLSSTTRIRRLPTARILLLKAWIIRR